jgi:aqualysin 1
MSAKKEFNPKQILPAIMALVLLVSLFLSTGAVQAQETGPAALVVPQGREVVPDSYIVVYKDSYKVSNVKEDTLRSDVAALGGKVQFVYGVALNGYSAYLSPAALAAVRANPNVDYVQADTVISLPPEELSSDGVSEQTVQAGATWGLARIDQRDLPVGTDYNYDYDGTGVNVYVIDTGIRTTHTEFGGRADKKFDAIGDGQNGNDCAGHGTHVAGTIGGSTYGVAKNASLHAVRVLNCAGSGTSAGFIAGLNWVATNRVKPAVANASLGFGGVDPASDTAATNMINKGVIFVVAAGNSTANACGVSPAHVTDALTVGATDNTDTIAWFSNYGSCLDIFAPGQDITSAWYTSNTATNTISGTSMASPHVAGVVALYLQTHTGATNIMVKSALLYTASLGKVNGLTGTFVSPNRLVYSLLGPVYTPAPIAPTGTTTDTTPTYKWAKVAGATNYQVELTKGGVVQYTKTVAPSACVNVTCTTTPTNVLATATYKWRTRAYVGAGWKTWSEYTTFIVGSAGPKAGYWSGAGDDFTVTANQLYVSNYSIYISVSGCGSYKITHGTSEPIASGKTFAFSGSFYANGTFGTTSSAYGSTGLSSFYISGCGYVSGGPFSWTSTWVSADQPAGVTLEGGDQGAVVEQVPFNPDYNTATVNP